tara:strand:+ start:226 stop:909 length:684 start_codon:yes stop_codon:yes gene_type:complete
MDLLKARLTLAVSKAAASYSCPDNDTKCALIENRHTDAQVYVQDCHPTHRNLKYDKIISFRGTSSKADIFADLKIYRRIPEFFKKHKMQGRVHSGFLAQYESVRDQVHQMANVDTSTHIMVTGHSLGGALATLCALDLAITNPSLDVDCITFGSPRVGCKRFVKLFTDRVHKHVRCVHNNDLVTKIPIAFRFKHTPGKLKLTTPGSWIPTPIKDHEIVRYTDGIKAL